MKSLPFSPYRATIKDHSWTIRGVKRQKILSVVLQAVDGVSQQITQVEADPVLITAGIFIGVGASIFAAWIPSRNAACLDPVQGLQKGKYQALSDGENRTRRWAAVVTFIASMLCLFFSSSKPVFYGGYVLNVLAGLLLAPTLTLLLSKSLRPMLKRLFPAEGALAADSLVQAPRRTSATVSALMLSVAIVVGVGGSAHSFYASMAEWLDNAFNPDYFIAPSENLASRAVSFPNTIGSLVENIDGVSQVQLVRDARVNYRGVPFLVMAIETSKVANTTPRVPLRGSPDEMNRLTAQGSGLIVSESFSANAGARMGEILELPTPSGLLKLPIVGVVRDYSDLRGTIFIDRFVYRKWWKDDSANVARIYVKKGYDLEQVRHRIIDAVAGKQRLLVLTNRDVRERMVRIVDDWFGMTYNQIVVAVIVAILGIVNTLTVSITDRKREFGIIQAVGGSRTQVRRAVWIEALTIGIIGLVLGAGLGAANLYYSLGMVKRDLGGIGLDYLFPFPLMMLMVPIIIGAAFVAAIGPGEAAVRGKLVEALEYE